MGCSPSTPALFLRGAEPLWAPSAPQLILMFPAPFSSTLDQHDPTKRGLWRGSSPPRPVFVPHQLHLPGSPPESSAVPLWHLNALPWKPQYPDPRMMAGSGKGTAGNSFHANIRCNKRPINKQAKELGRRRKGRGGGIIKWNKKWGASSRLRSSLPGARHVNELCVNCGFVGHVGRGGALGRD